MLWGTPICHVERPPYTGSNHGHQPAHVWMSLLSRILQTGWITPADAMWHRNELSLLRLVWNIDMWVKLKMVIVVSHWLWGWIIMQQQITRTDICTWKWDGPIIKSWNVWHWLSDQAAYIKLKGLKENVSDSLKGFEKPVNEGFSESHENVLGILSRGGPCYRMAESLAKLQPAVTWKIRRHLMIPMIQLRRFPGRTLEVPPGFFPLAVRGERWARGSRTCWVKSQTVFHFHVFLDGKQSSN